jgi:O-antigen/teichoic acid export membrane protein
MNEPVADPDTSPIARTIAARAVALVRVPLYRNALVLMGSAGFAAGLGFLFWAIAARLYPPAQLGLASATISSALFVTTVAQFGLPYALVRFSPSAGPGRAVLTSTVVLVVTLAGAVAGGIFIAGMNAWAPALDEVAPRPVLAAAVMALAGATGASTVLVYVAIGDRDTRPALVGGLTHGVVKSALIIVFAMLSARLGFAVVFAWLLGTAAAVLVQLWLLRAQFEPRVDLQLLRLGSFLRYSAGNYAGDLAWTAPGLLFPLLVVGLLGAEANAYFYVAWAIAGLLAGIPTAVASSLLAEGSHSHSETGEHLRRALILTLVIVVPAVAICWVGAQALLSLFGTPYAAKGVDELRLLSLAAVPLSLNVLYLAVARVDRAMRRILGITAATGGGALLLGAALAPQQGAAGIALAYLAAQTTMAIALTTEWWLRGRARS